MTAQATTDMLTRARALLRIQRAARLVEYDLWRAWPIDDEKPGVIADFMPWMAMLVDDLFDPDGPEFVIHELVDNVLRSCAPSLDPFYRIAVWTLLSDRVDRNPAIARALAGA